MPIYLTKETKRETKVLTFQSIDQVIKSGEEGVVWEIVSRDVEPTGIKIHALTTKDLCVPNSPRIFAEHPIRESHVSEAHEHQDHQHEVHMPHHTDETAPAGKKPRKPRRSNQYVAAGSAIRENTYAAKVLHAALGDKLSYDEIATLAEYPVNKVVLLFRSALRVKHGVSSLVDSEGKVHVVLPTGFDENSIFAPAAERKGRPPGSGGSGGPRNGKRAKELTAAQQGEWPTKPVITSETNKHRQKHLDKLHDLAEAGEWSQIENYELGKKGWGKDTYSKLIHHYQECLLAAYQFHAAQPEASATEAAAE